MQRDTKIQDPNFDGTLPAAGAFTSQAYSKFDPSFLARRLTIAMSYTKAAAAATGKVKIQIQWEIAGQAGYFEPVLNGAAAAIAADVMSIPEYKLEVVGPPVTVADPLLWRQLGIEVPSCATGVRVLAAEAGDAAHPGNLTVNLSYSDVL
jgi:hypothetical protein